MAERHLAYFLGRAKRENLFRNWKEICFSTYVFSTILFIRDPRIIGGLNCALGLSARSQGKPIRTIKQAKTKAPFPTNTI